MKPHVSVIMPAKNEEKYISSALQSIINQTFENWELIVVDDKSEDNTKKIISEFSRLDRRITLLEGDGICSGNARNKAVGICSGRYIVNMDADDVCSRDRIEKLVQCAEKWECSVIGSNVNFCDSELSVVKTSNYPLTNKEIRAGFRRFLNRFTIMPGTLMFTSNILRKYKYNEFYHILTDWDLVLRLGENPLVHFENVQKPLYYYRRNEGSMTYHFPLRAKFNLLLRYNEFQRKRKLPEIRSITEFENMVKSNCCKHVVYMAFYYLKLFQNHCSHYKKNRYA